MCPCPNHDSIYVADYKAKKRVRLSLESFIPRFAISLSGRQNRVVRSQKTEVSSALESFNCWVCLPAFRWLFFNVEDAERRKNAENDTGRDFRVFQPFRNFRIEKN